MTDLDMMAALLVLTNAAWLFVHLGVQRIHERHIAELKKIDADYVKSLKASCEETVTMWRNFALRNTPGGTQFYDDVVANITKQTEEKH